MGLFELSGQIRKVVGVVGLIIIIIAFLWFLWLGLRGIYRAIFPQARPTPIASFGKISKPGFPKSNVDIKNTVFSIEIPEGNLPVTPTKLNVYPILRPAGTLSSLDEAKERAKSIGFRESPVKLSEVSYSWKDPKVKARSLVINIVTGELTYQFDYKKDSSILQGRFNSDEDDIIKRAKRFLQRSKSLTQDIESGSTKINFYKITSKKLSSVTSFSEANGVEVLFFRKPIDDKYPIVQSNPQTSYVKVLFGPNFQKENGVIRAEFAYWNFDFSSPSLYPLKTAQTAWEEFQQGKASFVMGSNTKYDEIFLTQVSLAYFESKSYHPYAQPVFVFTGNGSSNGSNKEFSAYLPAVSNDYLIGAETSQ